MKLWLKIICIVFLVYTAVFAFKTPLIPGGMDVSTDQLQPGKNTFTYIGYNTHFDAANQQQQFFISVGKQYYCAEVLHVEDATHAVISVDLPDTLSSKTIGFYSNNDLDGTVYIRKSIDTDAFVINEQSNLGTCDPQVKTDEHSQFGYPFQIVIYETIRNLMWHVPMWFTMFLLMGFSFAYSIKYLNQSGRSEDNSIAKYETLSLLDRKAATSASVGLVFCILGLTTGSFWARFTWGDWWPNDPQLNGALVVFIVYVAYFILRGSTKDEEKRGRLAAIFNIFALVMMVILLMVMPRFSESLHPGKDGTPAFSAYDLNSTLRTIFYPAVIGWALLGYWIYSLVLRIRNLEIKNEEA